jgi:hypothetical protein
MRLGDNPASRVTKLRELHRELVVRVCDLQGSLDLLDKRLARESTALQGLYRRAEELLGELSCEGNGA